VHSVQVQQPTECHLMQWVHWPALRSCSASASSSTRVTMWTDGRRAPTPASTSEDAVLQCLGVFWSDKVRSSPLNDTKAMAASARRGSCRDGANLRAPNSTLLREYYKVADIFRFLSFPPLLSKSSAEK
jgi:hypothetical protein